ncbi:MAG: hypothetical protein Fur0037_15070 [Planctomycetota bacterium]
MVRGFGRALPLWLAGSLAGPALCQADADPAEWVFVEVLSARDTVRVGQVFDLVLRIGWDRERFLARAVQPFQQPLDVPVQVDAAWLRGGKGLSVVGRIAGERRIVLGGEIALAEEMPDEVYGGRTYGVVRVVLRAVAEEAGILDLAPLRLRFSYATSFEESLLRGRVPRDRRDVTVEGSGARVRVLELPADGRPDGFTGAIGVFAVASDAHPRVARVGEEVAFEVRVEGRGNLARIAAPAWRPEGFHVLGVEDRIEKDRRVFGYRLAITRPDVEEVPAFSFWFFDPDSGYRCAVAPAVPLRVLGGGAALPDGPGGGPGDILPLRPLHVPVGPVAFWVGMLGPWALGALVMVRVRRIRRCALDPAGERARSALGALRHALEAGADPAPAFAEFLTAEARLSAPRAHDPSLAGELRRLTGDSELTREALRAFDALIAARHGGGTAPSPADLLELARRIDAAVRKEGRA